MKSAFCMWALPVWECQKAVKEPPTHRRGTFQKRALPYRRVLTRTTRYAVWWPSVTTLSTKDCTDLSSFASPSWSRRGRGWAGWYLTLYVYLVWRLTSSRPNQRYSLKSRFVVATRDIEPLELVMWDNAAALGPRMGTAPVCLQVF